MKVGVTLIVSLMLIVVTMLFYTETKLLYSQSTNTAEVEACNKKAESNTDCQTIRKWKCRYINFMNPFAVRIEEEESWAEMEDVLIEGVDPVKQGVFNSAAPLISKLPTKDTRFLVGQIVLEKSFAQSDFDSCPRFL